MSLYESRHDHACSLFLCANSREGVESIYVTCNVRGPPASMLFDVEHQGSNYSEEFPGSAKWFIDDNSNYLADVSNK